MLRVGFVLVAASLVATACDAGSPEPDDDTERAAEYRSSSVDAALEDASAMVRTRGFSVFGDSWRGFLVHHSADVREQPMRAGTCYVVLGAASSGIRQVELRVFDSEGGELAHDTGDGRYAGLRFCPTQSGVFYLSIRAASGSGLFSVQTFRGPTGLSIRLDDVFATGGTNEGTER